MTDNFQRMYLTDNQISKARNNTIRSQIYLFYYQTLLEDILSIFKWKGLPQNVPSYALEWCLLKNGKMVGWLDGIITKDIITDEPVEYSQIRFSNYMFSRYDEYMQPLIINIIPIFPNGSSNNYKSLDAYDFEYCYNNLSGLSDYRILMFFVDMLTDIEVSIKLTTRQLRQPYIFEGTKGSKQSITQLMKKIDEGNTEYFVLNDDFLKDGKLQLHNLLGSSPEKRLDSLYMLKEKYLQEWYTRIGLHTNINNKQERLTENESIGHNEIGNMHITGKLEQRKDFCERMNKHFGLEMSVDYSNIIRPLDKFNYDLKDNEVDTLVNEESE